LIYDKSHNSITRVSSEEYTGISDLFFVVLKPIIKKFPLYHLFPYPVNYLVSVHKVGYFADRPCISSPKGCENAVFKEVCP
jgi:hypothetical protein